MTVFDNRWANKPSVGWQTYNWLLLLLPQLPDIKNKTFLCFHEHLLLKEKERNFLRVWWRLSIHDTKIMNVLLEPNGWQNIVSITMKNNFDLS